MDDMVEGAPRPPDAHMLTGARHAAGTFLGALGRLSLARDPVLLQGRQGRWRWPWAIGGLVLTALLIALFTFAFVSFEDLAIQQQWTAGGFPQTVFPIDPAQPFTYVDMLLGSLIFLLPPLMVLPIAHGVSWRRALSYGAGFQWRQFWRAALALLVLAMLALLLGWLWEPHQYRFHARPPVYAVWIGLALVVIFVQSFGEEVLFRGYLVRVAGAVLPFRLPVTAAVIAVFVTGHLWNEDLQKDMLFNVIYFVAGEVIAYAVLFRTQNLAASAGLHWMNNVLALLTPTVPGQTTLLALAVYTDPVYVAGGTRLFDPLTHAFGITGMAMLLTMLFWRRSPFYLERAPVPRGPVVPGERALSDGPPDEPLCP